jgi:hypothetical protein
MTGEEEEKKKFSIQAVGAYTLDTETTAFDRGIWTGTKEDI